MQLLAERDHALYPLISVLRAFRDSLFDHLVPDAHIQPAVFGFVAERLYAVIYLRRLLFRRRCFGILIEALWQVLNSFGERFF